MKFKFLKVTITTVILAVSSIFNLANAGLISYDSLDSLSEAVPSLVVEDWRSYEQYTVLSNTTLNGITYPDENSFQEPLVTLGPICRLGEFWRIGYLTDDGSTRNFGRSAITFKFTNPITAFSLSLIQGINDPIDGESIWNVTFDNE
jgi:hypothetical protein